MTTKAAVVGLDGAAWHLLDPMIERGVMPRLAALRKRGASGTLHSTVPTYTPPAWTAAATGVNPGRHGIYGFIQGNAQSEKHELVHSGRIRSATIWEIANAQGARAGIYNLPLTYPPRPLDGWMVSGMMTPGYGENLEGFVSPLELEAGILERAPGYVVDVSANWERDWRDTALCDRIVTSLGQRYEVLDHLLTFDPPNILFSVLEAPDRLQHVYYRYLDPADPLYGAPQAFAVRAAVDRCFKAMDDIVGLIEDYVGSDGGVIVCSDHGFTAWEVSVHTNALLQQWGFLKVKPQARAMQTTAARRLVPIAKRFLPARAARRAKGATFSAIDWSRTRAFASPIPLQGVFVNLEGRERFGIVAPGDLEAVKDDLVRRFQELSGPEGAPVTDHVHRSEDVFHGDALEGAPDIMPVLRNHRFELDDELFFKRPFTDQGHLPRGVHHPDGIVAITGPGVAGGVTLSGSVMDVTPTLLYQAGLEVPENLDGSMLAAAFTDEALRGRPVAKAPALSSKRSDEASPYSKEEEAAIEESLRGLGYL